MAPKAGHEDAEVVIHHDAKPSEAAPKPVADKRGVFVNDELGRVLKVRKINALARYDLAKLVGGGQAANAGVMGPAMLAFACIEIDGEAIVPPQKEIDLRALIARLDDEGLGAIAKAYAESGWVDLTDIDVDALKN